MFHQTIIIVLCVFAALVSPSLLVLTVSLEAQPSHLAFEQWRILHQKEYASADELRSRSNVFHDNLAMINRHNAGPAGQRYRLALNEFADQTWEEFRDRMLGSHDDDLASSSTHPLGDHEYLEQLPNLYELISIPNQVDWVKSGKISPVKNQGHCGSCWSFCATGMAENAHAIATGELLSLSEQELVDCSVPYGTHGCHGARKSLALRYILDKGLCTEASYPYQAMDNQCRSQSCSVRVKPVISSVRGVHRNNQDALTAAVATAAVGVSIAVNRNFHFYHSGVFDDTCGERTNHAVLVVGYGTASDGKEFYKVKNSWGRSWGEQGYIRIKRGHGHGAGLCEIAKWPIVAIASAY